MANNVTSTPGHLEVISYQQITSLSSATGLTVPDKATHAFIQPEAQNVRWRDDGNNPTASVGMLLVANDLFIYTGTFSAIKFIEVTASAKLNVTYYRNKG
ncbi:MAG TPA: hypothetical protein PKW79_00055 [Rhabdochlamydiaceae bacterium]|nr:hypothetical protein [Rhabdochlamydiaceae bacterium]